MSSIPNNGLVTVAFQVDRSSVDSYLAELRKGVTVPVRADYVGPAGPSGGGTSAASIAGSNGPATFGNLAGAPVYGSGASGIFMGGPGGGIAAMTATAMSYNVAGGGGGANALQPAASALQSAAMELKTAAAEMKVANRAPFLNASDIVPEAPFLNMSDVVGEGPGAAAASLIGPNGRRPATGGSRGTGRSYSGRSGGRSPLANIGRYFGAGLVAHQLVDIAAQAVNEEDQLSTMQALGAPPEQQAQTILSNAQRWRSGGILGLNPFIYKGFDWMAKMGINPGNIFSQQSDDEKAAIASIQKQQSYKFDFESREIAYGTEHRQIMAGILNPDNAKMEDIQFETDRTRRQISERYALEKIRRPNDVTTLEQEKQKAMGDAAQTGKIELARVQDDIQYRQKNQFLSAVGDMEAAQYRMLGRGESAVRSEAAYRRQQIISSRDRNFTFDEEGEKAYQATLERNDAQLFEQLHNMHLAGQAKYIPLAIQNRSMNIGLHASSPAMGRLLSQINTTGQSAIFEAYETSIDPNMLDADKTKTERAQLEHGKLQLQEFQQSWFRSNQPRQISSINQQALNGPGTAKSSEITGALNKMAAVLEHIMSNTSELNKTVRDFSQDWN